MLQEQAQALSPLKLAFIGDAVYTLHCRTQVLESGHKPKQLHRMVTQKVRAGAQAKAMQALWSHLSSQEEEIAKRGRNAHARHSCPKGATTQEYALSTAFEALIGYLYLTQQHQRLQALLTLTEVEDAQDAFAC